MQRAIRHKSIEQARRLQKVDEKRQLPKRRKSRLPVPFDMHRTRETVDQNPPRRSLTRNRRWFTRRVKARAAYIVLDDADMDKAVKWGVVGRMNNAGQACCAAKRFILEEPIADEFVNRFKAALAKFIPGDPADPKTTLAPLCTEGALTKVESQIDSALKGGATVLLGGKRVDRQGYFSNRRFSQRQAREPCVSSGVLCSRGDDLPREERR